jgi:hypothetical protein
VTTQSKALREYRIKPGSAWSGSWKTAAAVGVVGAALAGWGFTADKERFAFAYLFAFFVALSVPLGSMFFVLVLHVTKAAWGVTVRRTAELFMRPMYLFAVLAIPLVFCIPQLFPWADGKAAHHEQHEAQEHADQPHGENPLAEDRGLPETEPAAYRDPPVHDVKATERAEDGAEAAIVAHKHFYFSRGFFFGRLFFYLIAWYWIAGRLFEWSTDQDKTKALENTRASQSFAPLGLILFGLTTTFFAFDWLLSLDATWYSTMFGVQIFAQCALVQIASLILVTLLMRKNDLIDDKVLNVEHYHDLGKLLFGWVVFWSYVTFAQFFLTWYSNIPDEVMWFHKRWHDNGGTWKMTSLLIITMHFFVPFWFLLSRNIKRRLPMLATGALCMVVMHVIEVYWVVMPNYGPLGVKLVDLGCLMATVGFYLALVLRGMEDYSLVAVGDPRLSRALEFENA